MRWGNNPYFAATLSGLLLAVSTRVDALGWLVFVFLIPTLFALRGARVRRWAGTGAWLYFVNALASYYWIYHVSYNFGGVTVAVAIVAAVLFAFMNIWQGLIGFGLFRWIDQRVAWSPAFAFTLVFTTVWHFVPAMFSWDFALSLLSYPLLIQAIDVVGAMGLDYFIIFCNFAIYNALQHRAVSANLTVAAALLLVIMTYSYWRGTEIAHALPYEATARVALVQPNLDSGAKADPKTLLHSIERIEALSKKIVNEEAPDLLVWPEALFPLDYQRDFELRYYVNEMAAEWNTWILFGNDHWLVRENDTAIPLNAATLVSPIDGAAQHYYKHVLLAFGEYIPGLEYFPWLRDLLPPTIGRFGRGEGPARFELEDYAIAPIICYESIQRDYMRRVASQDIDFIVELTNDGWYGRTAALAYHKNLTRLRAIENRVSIARDTNTGITTFIDPLGKERQTLAIETEAVAWLDVPLWKKSSPYAAGGYHFRTFAGIFALCALGLAAWQGRRKRGGAIHISVQKFS